MDKEEKTQQGRIYSYYEFAGIVPWLSPFQKCLGFMFMGGRLKRHCLMRMHSRSRRYQTLDYLKIRASRVAINLLFAVLMGCDGLMALYYLIKKYIF